MGKKRKKMRGTVEKIIKPVSPLEPEKAQIKISEADDLYREVRVACESNQRRILSSTVGSEPLGKFSTLSDSSTAYQQRALSHSDLLWPVMNMELLQFYYSRTISLAESWMGKSGNALNVLMICKEE